MVLRPFETSLQYIIQNDSLDIMKFVIFTTLALGCGLCVSQEAEETPPRVVTPLGEIEGYYKISNGGRQYKAYEGIPYAQPPTGEFRFQVARQISPWSETLMAKQLGSTCLQYGPNPGQNPPGIVSGSEDCLFLNVYTAITDNPQAGLLPVIIYIHGGAFQFGSSGDYGPKYLLDQNLTLVTLNYRLGPFGFLSTEDEIVPGNMGLKDQVMALRWVKENIEFFGGDPSRITIVGQSAGGASVHYHLLSKLSSGLFQRAMSLSGNVLNPWAQTENSLEKAKQLATIVGCPTQDVRGMVDCLRVQPANQITEAIGEFMPFLYNPFTPFGPVVEKGGDELTFIDRPPIEIITSGRAPQDVPWITSAVSEEGLYPAAEFLAREELLNELNENWETIAPHLLDFNYTIPEADHAAVAKLIREQYLGTSPIDKSTTNQTVQMVSDRLFVYNAQKAATLHARANQSPVRFYYFTYRGAHSVSETFSGSSENFGVSHGDDVCCVMDTPFFDPTTTAEDRNMQQSLINIWVSYATDGTPDVGVEWPEVSKSNTEELRYLRIAGPEEINVESASDFGEKNFWSTVDFRENVVEQ